MNNDEIQKLKALAKAVLNHSDSIGEDEWYSADENMSIFAPNPDLSFIAAANPTTVLELIAHIDAHTAAAVAQACSDMLAAANERIIKLMKRAEKAEQALALIDLSKLERFKAYEMSSSCEVFAAADVEKLFASAREGK